MNDVFSAFILAIVQGITEWFPVSSSGHLVIISKLLEFDNTLLFDVTLHFGTLMAVVVYFSKDIINILRDLFSFKFKTDNGRLGVYLIIATIPALVIGFLLRNVVEKNINNLGLLAMGLIITSIILFIGSLDIHAGKNRKLNYWGALLIGCAQVFSIFRGISRSGSTISSGLLFGLDEKTAVKFSFLMSIPVVLGANILTIGTNTLPAKFILPAFVSFIFGLLSIHVLLKFVLKSKKNLRWFALYVLLVALALGIYLLVY